MREKRKKNKWLRLGMLFGLLSLLGVAGFIAWPYFELYQANNESGLNLNEGETAEVFIKTGWETEDVAEYLSTSGLLKDKASFLKVAEAKNFQGNNIVPGKYELQVGWSNGQVIDHLRVGNGRLEVDVTFHNTHTLEEVSEAITAHLELDHEEFHAYITSDSIQEKYGFNEHTMISFFIPETYRMDWAISRDDLMARLAKEYKGFWTPERKEKAAAIRLSQSKVATLATIVMGEQSKKPDEWPAIAGLYLNRLKKDMKLQSDPTVKYALGDWTIRRVLNKHLEVDSPYNTYKNKGLPPGPIFLATKDAMDAVLNYKQHDYIYMCAKPEYSGYHNFAVTYNEHLRNAKAYRRWLDAEGIR